MNLPEQSLHYPFNDTLPATGTKIQVAHGIYWVRLALPFALNHVNVWLLKDEIETPLGTKQGWTLIDCGIDTSQSRASWEQLFANQTEQGLENMPIIRVISTHCHPDHVGLAHWHCEKWNAPYWMSAAEYMIGYIMSAGLPAASGTALIAHFEKHGLPKNNSEDTLKERKNYFPTFVPRMPLQYHRILEGLPLKIGEYEWDVIIGQGHSPEHVSLYCSKRKVLISGDMLLPRISTNVSVFAIEPEANPVALYVQSLQKFKSIHADTLVLPSHGKPFQKAHARIAQLEQHHAQRLQEVYEACVNEQTAYSILPIMFPRELDSHQLSFAMGEALAHLHQLWLSGKLKRILKSDGIFYFSHPTAF